MYGEGISHYGELIDLGVKAGIIEKAGAWFAYENNKIGQGRENAKEYLKSHPDIANKIEQLVRSKVSVIELNAKEEVEVPEPEATEENV